VTGKDLSSIPIEVLEAARNRGILIHADIEAGTMETPEGKWAEKYIPDRLETSFEGSEFDEIDGLVYAGRYDIATVDEIMDIKTQSEKDILAWTIQLNLYGHFYADVKKLSVLWLPKSGNYERVPIAMLDDSRLKEIIDAYREKSRLTPQWLLELAPEAESLELVIYDKTIGALTTNARAILATVKKQLEGYSVEKYSGERIQEAKRDKAELNAAAKKLNDKRLELEREFNKPFAEFKDTIAEACEEIKKASIRIDLVVKEVEEKEKAEKRKQLEEAWTALKCDLFDLQKIWKPEWLNKGSKNKETIAEMSARIDKAKADLVVLDRIGEPEAQAHYLDTLDLEKALEYADRLKANRERLRAAEAEIASRKVVSLTEPQEAPKPAENATATPPNVPKEEPKRFELEILERRMIVRATLAQLIALSRWMNENGINFEKIEGGSF
jgi:hypothetical protein